MNTKNALFATQNKSKGTAAETANNATNAMLAADGLIRRKYGRHTAKANRPPHSLPKLTDAVGRLF